MAIFSALSIGRSALLAHQKGLAVTGANITNVSTPGYSRQRAVFTAIEAEAGGGVRITVVEQIVDRFLERRALASESDLAGASAERELLDRVQGLFPVEDPSVGSALDDFFAAASDLSTHPEDIAVRQELLDAAEALAERLRDTAASLADLQREIDGRLAQAVRDAGPLLERVAELNRRIVRAQADGAPANELADARREALAGIASALGIRTVEREDGSIDVFARSGATLVLGSRAATLATESSTALGLDGAALGTPGFVVGAGNLIALTGDVGGEIGSLLALRDETLVEVAADLDDFAVGLRDEVNAIQTDPAGRDLDGLVGAALFTGSSAGDLAVALSDPRGIAAAKSAEPSDNENALALVALQTTALAALGDATLGDAFAVLRARVGGLARDAEDRAEAEDAFSAGLAAQRDAVSGVSLEEEFTDLILLERGFQAAAKLIAASDRMLDELLAMVGS